MYKHYLNYYWKEGKPYGSNEVEAFQTPASYKIVVDPYYKRFTLEKYHFGLFDHVVYDSVLLDFRHLTQGDQLAWQREALSENENQTTYLLRNQDDRAILIETLLFENNTCRSCQTSSVLGIPLAVHRMFYRSFNDRFNGVVLYDLEEHPVMMKTYEIDPETEEFTTLISEEWNMKNLPEVLSHA